MSNKEINTIWQMKPCDMQIVKELAYELEVPQSIAQVMVSRGIDSLKKAKKFVNLNIKQLHNPMELPDAKKAIERISKAIDTNEKIFVWGDYDVDGITSTAIVVTALKKMNANLEYKVPHRMEDGYDIKTKSVDEAIYREATLLMSVDCGILAFETAEYAKEKGIDLIVTDHHHPSEDGRIPDCIAVVNPNRDDPNYPGQHFSSHATPDFKRYGFDFLAGCGIAFKLMLGLAKYRKLDIMHFVDELIEFAALGTVADVAPMFDENRTIVSYGCQRLTNSNKPGLKELLRIANVKEVTTTSIGFQIGPRINAIGRLADAGTALSLMLAEDFITATMLANTLDNANRKRQEQQEKAFANAIALVEEQYDLENDHIIVLGSDDWHPGLIGLIAGKIAELYHKPTLICSYKDDGYAKGSCRSVAEFNILDALKSSEAVELFKKKADGSPVCGGHAFAAGFELPIANLDKMRKALNKYAADKLGEPVQEKIINIDARMPFHELNYKTYNALLRLSPFGSGNNNPIFVTKNLKVVEVKLLSNGKHMKLRLSDGEKVWLPANAWRKGHLAEKINVGDSIDITYTLDIDTWGGNNNLVLVIEDISINK
jgi:single-stranded-DNA-specific exonuclease